MGFGSNWILTTFELRAAEKKKRREREEGGAALDLGPRESFGGENWRGIRGSCGELLEGLDANRSEALEGGAENERYNKTHSHTLSNLPPFTSILSIFPPSTHHECS